MVPEAFALVAASACCHALWNLAARRVSGEMVVLWFGFGVGATLVFPVALYLVLEGTSGLALSWEPFGFVLMTGAVHAIYTILLASAYRHGEISLVYPVARGTGVALTAVLGFVLFGEQVTALGLAGIGLVLTGTFCFGLPVLRTSDLRRGYVSALGVGFTIAVYSLVDKAGVALIHPVVYIWAMFTLSFLFLGPVVVWQHEGGSILHRARSLWRYVGVVGTGYVVSYLLMLYALTLGPVSYLVATRESSVALGATLGILFLGERFTALKAGAILFMAGGVVCLRLG